MKLGSIAGTRLIIHPTFWLIVAFVGIRGVRAGLGLGQVAVEIAFVFTAFACVVLHEFGHAVAARRYGIRTDSITLYPIGGVARLERLPEWPRHELVVALAGPLINVVIMASLGLVLLVVENPFLMQLAVVNGLLVAFNMLPAFPMDGGRVLRALLAKRMPYARATSIAATVAKAMVVPFVIGGFLWNPFLLLIGAFVWFAAAAEDQAVQTRESLKGIQVMQASMTKVLAVEPEDRLSAVVELTLDSEQKDFPVTRDGEVIGALTQADLLQAIEQRGPDAIVADIMSGSPPTVAAGDPLQRAFEILQRTRVPFLPISDRGALVGIVTQENVLELIGLRKAMGGKLPIRFQSLPLGPEPAVLN